MPTALAPAPSRSFSSFTIGCGLLNIPVAIYPTTEDTGVARKEYTMDGHPVGRVSIDKETEAIIERAAIIKMATATDGTLVPLYDDEVIAVTAPNVRCEVVTFIPLSAVGSAYLPEKYYQVRPRREKGKADPNVDAAFAVFLTAMANRQVAALVKVALRGPARYAAVLPDGRMVTLHYAEGVRDTLPLPQVNLPEKVVALADQLVDAIGTDLPTLNDTNGPALQAYVDAKAAGNPTPSTAQAPAAPSFDILGALSEAVDAAQKAKPAKRVAKTPAKPAPAKAKRVRKAA